VDNTTYQTIFSASKPKNSLKKMKFADKPNDRNIEKGEKMGANRVRDRNAYVPMKRPAMYDPGSVSRQVYRYHGQDFPDGKFVPCQPKSPLRAIRDEFGTFLASAGSVMVSLRPGGLLDLRAVCVMRKTRRAEEIVFAFDQAMRGKLMDELNHQLSIRSDMQARGGFHAEINNEQRPAFRRRGLPPGNLMARIGAIIVDTKSWGLNVGYVPDYMGGRNPAGERVLGKGEGVRIDVHTRTERFPSNIGPFTMLLNIKDANQLLIQLALMEESA